MLHYPLIYLLYHRYLKLLSLIQQSDPTGNLKLPSFTISPSRFPFVTFLTTDCLQYDPPTLLTHYPHTTTPPFSDHQDLRSVIVLALWFSLRAEFTDVVDHITEPTPSCGSIPPQPLKIKQRKKEWNTLRH